MWRISLLTRALNNSYAYRFWHKGRKSATEQLSSSKESIHTYFYGNQFTLEPKYYVLHFSLKEALVSCWVNKFRSTRLLTIACLPCACASRSIHANCSVLLKLSAQQYVQNVSLPPLIDVWPPLLQQKLHVYSNSKWFRRIVPFVDREQMVVLVWGILQTCIEQDLCSAV